MKIGDWGFPCGLISKGMIQVKPKAVLAYCREKGVKAVDIRFSDGLGRWHQFSMPSTNLIEAVFERGLGHESCSQLLSPEDQTPWVVVPTPDAKYLDPLQNEPTLVLLASIQDAWTSEEAWFDPRSVSVRVTEAYRGAGVADDVFVSTIAPVNLKATQSCSMPDTRLQSARERGGGRRDPDFAFRSSLMNSAIECGLPLERHYQGRSASSEFLLQARPLVQACDDLLVLRHLIETSSILQAVAIDQVGLVSKSAWNFTKGTDSLIGGSRGFGLSDLGWYAAAGILKHQQALRAIAASSSCSRTIVDDPCKSILSDRSNDTLVGVEPMSNDPRYRVLSYRTTPVTSCPYLTLSAIAMAMLDGILQKLSPETELKNTSEQIPTESDAKAILAERLAEDSSFLMHAEVFSERLLESLYNQLATES
jgi:glutamine synthetase